MNPFESAFFLTDPQHNKLDVLEAHLAVGRVISTDRLFLLCRPVFANWPLDRICDPWEADEAGDCWYVWDISGDIMALKEIPHSWFLAKPHVLSFIRGKLTKVRGTRFLNLRKS